MTRLNALFVLATLGVGPLNGGCDYERVSKPGDCDERLSSQALGTWELVADGRRSECKNKDLNGDLTLEMRPFEVAGVALESDGTEAAPETDSEADAFVERIRRVRYRLETGDRVRFDFEGTSDTCSVDFTIHEQLEGNAFHEYEFRGYVTALGRIEGNFTGAGPSGCKSEGYFEIMVD